MTAPRLDEWRPYHPAAALHFLRRTLAVYLVPLVQVAFERNWAALFTALRQDAAIFAVLCAVSWAGLHWARWRLDDAGVLHLRWSFLLCRERTVRGEAVAALTLAQPVSLRVLGASRVVLYPAGQTQKGAVTLWLRRADADALADRLFPIADAATHRPAGGERVALVLLGANGLSTLALAILALRQTRDVFEHPLAPLDHLTALAARWLPVGVAWLLVVAAALLTLSLARSFAQTVHYTVWGTADQLGSRGGWLGRVEFRIRRSALCYVDVRLSPAARLMRRWPVFVAAGPCVPELPLFVFRPGQEELFDALLPGFVMPPLAPKVDTAKRSAVFFMPAGIPFALCALLTVVSVSVLPDVTFFLLVPTLYFLAHLGGAWMGYRREGVWLHGGRLTLRRQRGLYLHCICALHPDLCLTASQSPWAASVDRANLKLTFPGRTAVTVRSVPARDVRACCAFLEAGPCKPA